MKNNESLRTRDARHTWHPYTQHGLERSPLPVVGANGATLTLEDGTELLDGISSWWTVLHGHGEPALVEALSRQAHQLDHVLFAGATHEPAVRLSERLIEQAPGALNRVFFSDNGSTAVEIALKIAYQAHVRAGHPERQTFCVLEGSYHGDTFGTMSVGDPDPFFEPFRPFLFDVRRIPANAAALAQALDELGPACAGFLVEPLVQGAGGMLFHSEEFLREASALLRARGLPLIADEVMTGFGRTGDLFACRRAGIEPDLMCLAKGLTGGMMPLSVTLATEELFECFLSDERGKAFFHGHSFTAHPLGCAVANASLDLVLERDVPGRLNAIGATIEARLRGSLDPARTRNLRHMGGIVAYDLVLDEPAGYMTAATLELRERALTHGVLLRPLGDIVYAMPPACTTDAQAEQIADAMLALSEVAGAV